MICAVDPFPYRLHELFLQKAAEVCAVEIADIEYCTPYDGEEPVSEDEICEIDVTVLRDTSDPDLIETFDTALYPFRSMGTMLEIARLTLDDDNVVFMISENHPSSHLPFKAQADRCIEAFYSGCKQNKDAIRSINPLAVEILEQLELTDDFVDNCIRHYGGQPISEFM